MFEWEYDCVACQCVGKCKCDGQIDVGENKPYESIHQGRGEKPFTIYNKFAADDLENI